MTRPATVEMRAPWPAHLGEPEDPMQNVVRYRAQSLLTGLPMQDGGPAPLLPYAQARDVVQWGDSGMGWAL